MAQHVLGVDLGAHAVKAVLLESAYRGFSVLDHATVPVPPAEGDAPAPLRERQAAALRALIADRGWTVDAAVASQPGAAIASHVVSLPFTDPKRIEQTIPFEVEGQIPFDLADVAWDWQPLATRENRSELYVGVARKEELAGLLEALAGAGVDPRAVVPPGPAYASLFGAGILAEEPPAEPGAAPPAEAVLDVGHERTSLCVVAGGVCEAARTVAFGATSVARALGGAPLEDADPDALRRAFLPLVRELRATVKAWQARLGQRPIRRLHLAGEVGTLPALAALLAPEIEGPVEPLRLAGPSVEKLPQDRAPALALPLALALRGHQGARAPRLNLRRGALAYTRDFQHVKGKVARLAAFALLLLALAVASSGVKVLVLARQETALDLALCDAEQKIVGRCYENFEQAEAILRGRGGGGATIPKSSAVEVLAELGARAPAGVQFRFDRIEITREKLHLQGTTAAAEDVDRIVGALRASACFGDARSGGARRRGTDGKFEFSIDSAITCADGPSVQPTRGSLQ